MAYTSFPHPEERPSAASRRTHEARRRSSSARSGEMAAQRDEQRVGLCWRRVEAADEARDVARPAEEAHAILLEPIEHTGGELQEHPLCLDPAQRRDARKNLATCGDSLRKTTC